MAIKQSWMLVALLVGACAIPNVAIDDSLGGGDAGSADSSEGGTSSHGGKSTSDRAGSTTAGAAVDSSGGVDDTGQAGEPSLGGTASQAGEPSVGGTNSSGGKATGGAGGSRPMGGNGGTGGVGVPPVGAVAKFCNEVTIGGNPVKMELRIGSGANLVHIFTVTGTCQPVVNHACTTIPTGTNLPVNVFDPNGQQVWNAMVTITPGEAWIFSFYFNEATQMPEFAGKSDITAAQCSSTDFADLFGP